ncbi:EamA family transporter [Methylobacterium radiotolerans]|uniref:EamA family transporter n=1 Tax=Methylobacterium radiotolerans TaxID=31998 RepID=UPI001F191C92|nr:EamA family transporter [Methylobacterium radiotolerans]UIY41263.1 EamA family transporter [Methylobacterium radiotolerans]
MSPLLESWRFWALAAAGFAALTAILAKVGVAGVPSDVATFVRTAVILVFAGAIVVVSGQAGSLAQVTGRSLAFLILSGLATGASWLCYFRALSLGDAARVAPLDKLSVVLVAILGATLLGETLSLAAWAGVALIAAGAALIASGL